MYELTLKVRPSTGSWGSVIVHCKVEEGGRKWIALAFTCILHPPALPSGCGCSFCSALCQSPVTGLNMANSLLEGRCLEERKKKSSSEAAGDTLLWNFSTLA